MCIYRDNKEEETMETHDVILLRKRCDAVQVAVRSASTERIAKKMRKPDFNHPSKTRDGRLFTSTGNSDTIYNYRYFIPRTVK